MAREFKLPDLGEGIHEGEIVKVLVSVGDQVKEDQPILEVETDKATVEIPSPFTGTVSDVRVSAGDLVNVGDVLLVFDGEGAPAEEARAEEAARPQEATEEQVAAAFDAQPREEAVPEEKPQEKAVAEKPREPAPPAAEREAPPERQGPVPASPSTRRLAREMGVDLQQVRGSGPGGRVTAEDVRSFASGDGARAAAEAAPPREAERRPAPRPAGEEVSAIRSSAVPVPPLPDFQRWGEVERVPLRSLDDIAQWYTKFGLTKEAFLSASSSFAVNTKINRSKAMVPRWGVAGTPTIIINGKYRFDVASAGGHLAHRLLADRAVRVARGLRLVVVFERDLVALEVHESRLARRQFVALVVADAQPPDHRAPDRPGVREPFGAGARRKQVRKPFVDMIVIADAAGQRVKPGIVGLRIAIAQRGEECGPVLVGIDQHADMPVAGGVGTPVWRQQARIAGGAARRLETASRHVIAEHELRHRLEHRNLDRLPFAGPVAMQQRGEDRVNCVEADNPVLDVIDDSAAMAAAGIGRCFEQGNQFHPFTVETDRPAPVSYTHLTLPTIHSV